MYLKEIKAHGFKSFADKINFELTKGITGIVGPNGSGKSNVVDAVRWVLGEQSVKSLRGSDNMTDVIFSGSKSRSASNTASVTLIFDNSDHYLQTPYEEVSIKRRVYKDGTNEYYLNEEKVRLKDIIELLMDNGMAKESLNIISQGKIDEIVLSKPDDRRVIFEEAAGVLKYKKRKEEAIRKLDKTHDNMTRVRDIISELESQIEPLRKQKEEAIKYLEAKEELEGIEIALIIDDITNINYVYQDKKGKIDELNNEIMSLSTNSTKDEARVLDYKNKISKQDEQLRVLQSDLLSKTSEVEKINSQKAIILERQKYKADDSKLHDNIVNLEEAKLKLEHNIHTLGLDIENTLSDYKNMCSEIGSKELHINELKENRMKLDSSLTLMVRNKTTLESQIHSLRESIDNNSSIPSSVRAVLSNPKLRGINDVIGKLIEVEDKYSTAISTSLGPSSSYIVVDDEMSAKEAINYLKISNAGRATFFPINVIKAKNVDINTLKVVKESDGFIGIGADLVKFNSKYTNIIFNQLGNVIVVDNIDNGNKISKKINYSYRIVTLDGELLHVGGSLTGGYQKIRNIITDKYDLEIKLKNLDKLILQIKDLEDKVNEVDSNLLKTEDELYVINKTKIELETFLGSKNNRLRELKNDLDKTINEINGTNHIINNSLSDEEKNIMELYYSALKEYEEIKNKYDNLSKEQKELYDELSEFEFSMKRENNLFYNKNKELKDLEIEVNRMDVKLDNLLTTLSETYNMTYENATTLYRLELEPNIARNKVNSLKKIIKEIGIVNLAAPEEYDRVSKRYEFLIKQSDDLTVAENTLLEIISEMDEVMKKDFIEAFKVISKNFTATFRELFKGGHAELKLTNPDDILGTGVEIIASPPGKSLKSISLLSGGEKTFTAISLLFAILKSRKVPFCILDEVEAALDEPNVDSFGKYLISLKEMTQFILITHKKRTMEYVDVLYGVTMQESGVSKLVSVKLEDVKG